MLCCLLFLSLISGIPVHLCPRKWLCFDYYHMASFTLTLGEIKMEIEIGYMLHCLPNKDNAKAVVSTVVEQYDS